MWPDRDGRQLHLRLQVPAEQQHMLHTSQAQSTRGCQLAVELNAGAPVQGR